MTDEAIRFTAQVVKVQTTVDGGIRLTLDMPETAVAVAAQLMQVKQAGALLEVAAVPVLVVPEKPKSWRDPQN